ncbi:hypothetical protein JB92DRAFT_1832889 [Gautieria morchelliformis]|nr:hypothetical protein JB92DRAFT_1832889 [Gautieria morchelliformis]
MGVPYSSAVSKSWLLFHGWSGFCFFAAVQVISQLRLWAIYRSKRIMYAMSAIIVLGLVGMGLVEGFGYHNLIAIDLHAGGLAHICGPMQLPHYVYTFWIPPLLIETISVTLVVYKAIRHFRLGAPKSWTGSRFMNSIVRYSVLYFVTVLCVYVADFYVWFQLRVPAFELFIPFTFALPSMAGNRMLLSLRGIFYEDHAVLPGKDDIGMKTVNTNPDRGLTVERHNPLKEFESFFGENNETAA